MPSTTTPLIQELIWKDIWSVNSAFACFTQARLLLITWRCNYTDVWSVLSPIKMNKTSNQPPMNPLNLCDVVLEFGVKTNGFKLISLSAGVMSFPVFIS